MQVHIRTQTELATALADSLNDSANNRWTVATLYRAINEGLQVWGDRVTFPAVYNISGGFVPGTYEYTLPEYMQGRVYVEFKQTIGTINRDGDDTDRDWARLNAWEVYPNTSGTRTLRLHFNPTTTPARVIWYGQNGPIPVTATLPVTNAEINSTDTSVVLTSKPTVAQAGYIKIDSEILFYAGTTEGASTLTLNNLVRPIMGTAAATHSSGSTVTWCVAVDNQRSYQQLMHECSAWLHMWYTNKASGDETERHVLQARYYKQLADEYWATHTSGRKGYMRLSRAALGPGIFEQSWQPYEAD